MWGLENSDWIQVMVPKIIQKCQRMLTCSQKIQWKTIIGSVSSLVQGSLLIHKLKSQRNVNCEHIWLSRCIYGWGKSLLTLVGRRLCEAWNGNHFQGITCNSYFYLHFSSIHVTQLFSLFHLWITEKEFWNKLLIVMIAKNKVWRQIHLLSSRRIKV